MQSKKRTVEYISRQFQLDSETSFILLLENKKLRYLNGTQSVIRDKDLRYAKTVLKNSFLPIKPDEKRVDAKREVIKKKYDFSKLGKPIKNIIYLNRENILDIHYKLVEDLQNSGDPIYPMGIKDNKLLEGAIFFPQTSYGSTFKYSTIETSAAAILYSLIQDHPFHNGNKRTALVSLLVFLDNNNYYLTCNEKQLYDFVIKISAHLLNEDEKIFQDQETEIYIITTWIINNIRMLSKGEKTIKFKRLIQILKKFDCIVKTNGKVTRIVKRKFLPNKEYKTNLPHKHENQDVGINLLKKVRRDLRLDEENGFDKERFYGNFNEQIDEYIEKYRKSLRKLSKN